MTIKHVCAWFGALWYLTQPIAPQHQSREAWLAHCKKTGKSPDGKRR